MKDGIKVKLVKACNHAGEDKKAGDTVTVTQSQKQVMQQHGLVQKES